jgi:recombination protein RecR
MLSETDPCQICSAIDRQDDLLCVVETSSDIQIIENMNEFKGRYFVLGHLLSLLMALALNRSAVKAS